MTVLRLIVEADGRRRELELDVDDKSTGRAIYEALAPKIGRRADEYGLVVTRLDEAIHPDCLLSYYELRTADHLTVVGAPPPGPPPQDAPWLLKVVTGPAAGVVIPVREGETMLGRTSEPGAHLGDDAVSRRHAVITATRSQLMVADAGSTNGTYVNGGKITTRVRVDAGDHIGIGDSLLEVIRPQRAGLPSHLTYDAGALSLNRPPRVSTDPPAQTIDIAPAPETPPKQRLPLLASLIPVVIGGILFVVVGMQSGTPEQPFKPQWQYLLMTLAGPLMAIGSHFSNKRSGRSDFKDDRRKFLVNLEQVRQRAVAAREAAIQWRHRRDPRPEVVVHDAVTLASTLWHRRPGDADFLSLRLGTADQPSLVTVKYGGGGAPELAAAATNLVSQLATDPAVPLAIPVRDVGVVGVVGTEERLEELARWWAVQLATHHSPREAALVVVAPGREGPWDWAKWLPHVRALGTDRVTISTDDEDSAGLFGALRSMVQERASAREGLIASSGTTYLPHVVVFIQPPLRLPARDIAEFLEQAPQAGMSVVWFAEARSALPGACQVVVEDRGSGAVVTYSSGGEAVAGVKTDRVAPADAARVGLSLAPLRDVAEATADARIPDRVNLVDLIHPPPLIAERVMARWERAPDSLATVLGMGEGRPVSVDMISDGPHGLLGGTTGAGKSELLQTLIASLAVTYPPHRVNFVLVDYKGGAAFKDCINLPHTVGFVTDLDGRLAERAIVSLDAELKWREHVLAGGGFKDVAEMRRRDPAHAPANLIIVVDEFAALKSEVPDFVDGIVDIAQRGRSLGVHLLLATQKPGGIISADIQANTNLRIALRVTDAAESTDIIGRPDAVKLSRHLPGRAYVRTGSSEVATVQVAYVGGSGAQEVLQAPARTFRISPAVVRASRAAPVEGPSHLTKMVEAAAEAARRLGVGEQKRPWLPELADVVGLTTITGDVAGLEAPSVIAGLVDDAANQAQPPFVLGLETAGSAVIYGAAGTGKTTALRTIAASLAGTYSTREVHLYGLDFGGRGLAAIGLLPHCGDVVYGDELERVRRFITMLGGMADARRRRLGRVGASSAGEFRRITGESMPAIVTLIDGFGQLWSTLEPVDRGVHVDALTRLISEGRGAGLHFVLTADRRGALPPTLSSTIPTRILLRLATADEFAAIGGRAPEGFEKAPPGRCWAADGEIQFAVFDDDGDATGAAQARALQRLADTLPEPDRDAVPVPVRLLPDVVSLSELPVPAADSSVIPLGLDEKTLEPVGVDLGRSPLFFVVGPSGSGRTTALRTLTRGFRAANPAGSAYLLGTRRSSLFEEQWWEASARGADEADQLAQTILASLGEREETAGPEPWLVVIDDADDLTDGLIATTLETLLAKGRDAGMVVVAAMTNFKAERAYTNWVQSLRHERSGLILQPDPEASGDVLYVRLPKRAGLVAPPGRGYLVTGTGVSLIQVAS